jgi:LysR family glycine cleavage system transcriptional activator
MARRLPSLNALRAFEAASRLVSFTEAANELFVTHAAISRHIRELEDWCGVALFHRTGRGVELTIKGKQLSQQLTPLFDGLDQALRETTAEQLARKLKITVEPAIASRWLVPRLGRFHAENPDVELAFDASAAIADFRAAEVDIGIRFGPGQWPDVEAEQIAESANFPVCSPQLLGDGLADLSHVAQAELLHEERREHWTKWLNAAGIANAASSRGPLFPHHLAIEAAEAGQGFALADFILATDALLSGKLVRPFAIETKDDWAYWVVWRKGQPETAAMTAFRNWLRAEIADTRKAFQQFTTGSGAKSD